ncbi:MAG: helix-hairpin-helix domain-containing protein [Roseiflexaceae bacterium]
MRRSRLIAVGLIVLFGTWLVWKRFAQRRHAARQNAYAPEYSSPVWTSVPSSEANMTRLASIAESTHNQSDALAQPKEPALALQTSADSPLSTDTTLQSESVVESNTVSASANEIAPEPSEPAAEPDSDTATETDDETVAVPPDDLIRIEGIGPKISTIVFAAGITTFAELSATDVERLEAILEQAGIHTANPSTWPMQAHLAAQGQWDDLKELQDRIKNGQLEE